MRSFIGCVGAGLLSLAGCGTPTCGATDLDCVMSHLSMTLSGAPLPLVQVPAAMAPPVPYVPGSATPGAMAFHMQITPLSAPNFGDPVEMMVSGVVAQAGTGAGTTTPAPSITKQLADLDLSSTTSEQSIDIQWQDPNGMQPAFCFVPCDPNSRQCYVQHYFFCTRPLRDLQLRGFSPIRVRMTAMLQSPIQFGTQTTLVPTRVNPTPLLNGIPVAGNPAGLNVQPPFVPAANNPGGGNPGGGNPGGGNPGGNYTGCFNATPFCASPKRQVCTVQACYNGNCYGYLTSNNQWFPCSNCDPQLCTSAAMSSINACCQ